MSPQSCSDGQLEAKMLCIQSKTSEGTRGPYWQKLNPARRYMIGDLLRFLFCLLLCESCTEVCTVMKNLTQGDWGTSSTKIWRWSQKLFAHFSRQMFLLLTNLNRINVKGHHNPMTEADADNAGSVLSKNRGFLSPEWNILWFWHSFKGGLSLCYTEQAFVISARTEYSHDDYFYGK